VGKLSHAEMAYRHGQRPRYDDTMSSSCGSSATFSSALSAGMPCGYFTRSTTKSFLPVADAPAAAVACTRGLRLVSRSSREASSSARRPASLRNRSLGPVAMPCCVSSPAMTALWSLTAGVVSRRYVRTPLPAYRHT
jgi:hypothetical protein